MKQLYGNDLIKELKMEIERYKNAIENRAERIGNWMTDEDDCCISQRCEERGICVNQDKIELIKNGGCAWFNEYATIDGQLVNAKWCETRFGMSLRAEMPDGSIVWTTANTTKGLAKKGLKKVECKRPAWFRLCSQNNGMLGVYTGIYQIVPSDINYATGKTASYEPIEIRDANN